MSPTAATARRVTFQGGPISAVALGPDGPLVLHEHEGASVVRWLEGDGLGAPTQLVGKPAGQLITDGQGRAYACSMEGRKAVLHRIDGSGGPSERLGPIDGPHLAKTPDGELLFPRDGSIQLMEKDGTLRSLIDLPGAGSEEIMELPHRRQGTTKTRVQNLRSVLGRVGMMSGLTATKAGVFYTTTGDSMDTDAIRSVPFSGGRPRIHFAQPDEPDGHGVWVSRRLSLLAAAGELLAVVGSKSTTGGNRLAPELLLVRTDGGGIESRAPLASSSVHALLALGTRVAMARPEAQGEDAIETLTVGSDSWVFVARRKGNGLAVTEAGLWYGDGDALVFTPHHHGKKSAPSAKVSNLFELVKRAGGIYEVTSIQGKPAVRITAPDGSRAIKPVTVEELAALKVLVSEE